VENKKVAVKKNTLARPPVVTILGHVDHGKTTLLDYIRKTKVTQEEHGGITQHIGAYQIVDRGQTITFIDPPGHEAFSSMRSRGANVTDVAILVVAADDGVMPQTKESIAHIKAANVPMIVAINKMDLPTANVDRVKKGLSETGVLVEGYGGDVVALPISAKTGQGVDELLEMVTLVAELAELKDESDQPFEAVVIESSLDRFRGPLATILIKKGKLRVGDEIKTLKAAGKVKALISTTGEKLKEATISQPVKVLGFEKAPAVGEVATIGKKELLVEQEAPRTKRPLFEEQADGLSRINLIIKADVAGSLEAITAALENLSTQQSKVNIISQETGDITESDVLLAASTGAIIIGFGVKLPKNVSDLAEEEKVMVRSFDLIYELLSELKEGLESLAEGKKEQVLGKADVIATFDTSWGRIAGVKVVEGRLAKNDRINLYRNEEKTGPSRIKSIRHLQEEVNLAKEGGEYGLLLDGKVEFAVGDIIEAVS